MIKILRRACEYTVDEFKQYCINNGLDPELYKQYMAHWAIMAHEIDLNHFISHCGENTVVNVSGTVFLDNVSHKVKPKILTLKEAYEAMLTSDAQDFSIVLGPSGKYYVYVKHGRGHNVFKYALNDKKRTTTISD